MKFKNEKREIELIIKNMNSKIACFTGHRCQKLPWGFNEQDKCCLEMKQNIKKILIKAIGQGYSHFISGMAIGFDMICAELVLELRNVYPSISLECAIPCKGQEKLWSEEYKSRYYNILNQADKIRCIYKHYIKGCMQERNKYMVNKSSLLIALYDGTKGGTSQTIDYAKSNSVKTIIIKP